MSALFVKIPPLLLALAVALGAFGAHGLKSRVSVEQLVVWEKAVLYHFLHALALFVIALWTADSADRWGVMRLPYLIITGGIVLFSGSLYVYVLTQIKTFAMITPIGGLFFIAGWIVLALRKIS